MATVVDGRSGRNDEICYRCQVERFSRSGDRDRPPFGRQRQVERRTECCDQSLEAVHVARNHVNALVPYLGAELARRSSGHAVAVVDEDDLISKSVSLLQVLGREQHGHTLSNELAHGCPDHLAAAGVEARGRLVQDQQLRPGHEASREIDSSTLATREPFYELVLELANVVAVDQRLGDLDGGDAVVAAQARHQHQVLAGREVGLERSKLTGERDRAPDRIRFVRDIVATDNRCPTRRLGQSRQHPDDRGLTGPVRPEQGDDHAVGHREVEGLHGGERAELLGQTFSSDR